jgi:hypothetical protein
MRTVQHPVHLADGNETTIEDIRLDVEAAKKVFHYNTWCFSYVTVEALLEVIQQQQTLIDSLQPKKEEK